MTIYNDALAQYTTELFASADPVYQQILDRIPQRGLPAIAIRAEEGKFLQFLVRACGARKAVEIGTLGGYSGSWMARGLMPGGKLITLELEPKHAEVAREHFALAGVADRVEVRVGNAHDTLPRLSAEGPFDFCFIDAEKSGYDTYLDWALANVLPGGIIAAHNAFQHGAVVNADDHEAAADSMRAFNRRWATEPRLVGAIFPAGDGMLIGIVE
ncbi:MAG: O-methyltransferase [Anaerolineales bacterium]